VTLSHFVRVIFILYHLRLFSDEDMQSLASLMSVNTTGDIAPLEDFEEEDCKF
jgi:hypothetical protein